MCIRDSPYNESFDKHAKVFDLDEDEAILWPLNSPHRVDNSAFCVSVTTEYGTWASKLKNSGMLANATLRKKWGIQTSWRNEHTLSRYLKFVFGQAIKTTGLASKPEEADIVSFKLDPNVPNFIVDTPPYERNF